MTPQEIEAKVKRILASGEEGKKEALADIREGLLRAMYLEQKAGENPADAGKATEANARQSRKQFKELAELVMEVMKEVR